MSIEFVCPTCSGTLRVGDESAGRVIRCGACLTTLRVPETAPEPEPTPGDAPAPPPSPFENESGREPAGAVPVTRPRPRDRDRDRDPDERPRRRRRRRPPPPPGRSAVFWLGLIGGLFVLLIGGCCGGLYFAVPGPKWHTHESAKGGFKVDLPAPARKDMDKITGAPADPNMTIEGTILFRALEEYAVVYRDIPPHERGRVADEALMDEVVREITADGELGPVLNQKGITVNGFPGREVEFGGPGHGYRVMRVVLADGRLYRLVAGGELAQPGNENARRFVDSFEITDPKLRAIGDKKLAAAKRAEELERRRKEREEEFRIAREQAEAERVRQAEAHERKRKEREEEFRIAREKAEAERNIREAGRATGFGALLAAEEEQLRRLEVLRNIWAAGQGATLSALTAAEGEQKEVLRAIEAAAQFASGTRGAGGIATETTVEFGDAARRAALAAQEAARDAAAVVTGAVVRTGDRARFAEGRGRYTGRPPELPAEPVFRLAFDGTAEQRTTAIQQADRQLKLPTVKGGRQFLLPAGAEFDTGPSGTALYLLPETKVSLSPLLFAGSVTRGSPHTVSAWLKTTAPNVEALRFEYTFGARPETLTVRASATETLAQTEIPAIKSTVPPPKGARLTGPSIADGRWHHVAVTRDVTSTNSRQEVIRLYVDGRPVDRVSVARASSSSARLRPLALAATSEKPAGASDDMPTFAADEVCVFTGALNELEIRKLAGLEPLPAAPAPRAVPPLTFEPLKQKLPVASYLAVAFDSPRDELWLVDSARFPPANGQPVGPFLRRYSLRDLQEIGRYKLPGAPLRAVFDLGERRLYLVSAPLPEKGQAAPGSRSPGTLQLFDLAELEQNDTSTPPALRPGATEKEIRAYYALTHAPDGKHLYAVCSEGQENRPGKFSAYRFAPDLKGDPKGALLPDASAGAMFATDAAGGLAVVTGSAAAGSHRFEIDPRDWTVTRAERFPAPPAGSWVVAANGRFFSGGSSAVLARESAGASPQPTGLNVSAIALSPDRRYLFSAAPSARIGGPLNVCVYRADADWSPPDPLPSLGSYTFDLSQATNTMKFSADGRWLLLNGGRLVRVTGLAATGDQQLPLIPRPPSK